MEEVLELGVAEVGVDLSAVLNTGGGELEAVDSPREILLTLRAGAKRETLTKSGLIDLDDVDAGLLEVDDLVAESESELLSLDGLVDVVTGEGPAQAGDGTSKHTLHGLLAVLGGVLALLDGHRLRTGDVANDDRGTDAAGAVGLDPGVGGEDVTVHALTEVLHHVVTLRLTVDEDVEVKLLLDGDDVPDLLLDELLVLIGGNLTLGELVALDTDVLGLGEGADGGGGEHRELQVGLLLLVTSGEGRLAVVHLLGDLLLPLLDLRLVDAGGRSTGLHALVVGVELALDGIRAISDSLGDDGNLVGLLAGEREPVLDLLRELLLALESVGGVEERAGGSDNDTLLAELLDGSLDLLDGLLEAGLPDVAAVDHTSGKDLLGAKVLNHLGELLRVADQVDVESVGVLESAVNNVEVVDNVTEVGGQNELGTLVALESGELLVGGLEGLLDLGGKVEDKDGLVNLNGLGTSFLQLLEELLVDGEKLLEERDGLNGLVPISLAEGEERDWTEEDGASGDASLLSLEELNNGLGVLGELEGLVVLEGRLDVVVVGVEPLDHLERLDVDAVLLVATAHGEVLVNGGEVGAGVALGDGVEHLDVVEDVVVEGEVIAGDDVDAGVLLNLPVLLPKPLALSEEVVTRELATPVGLVGLLEVSELAHAREAEDGGLHHNDGGGWWCEVGCLCSV